MVKTSEIIKKIEELAPPYLACDWDNSGWQIRLGKNEVNSVLLCLSPTEDVIDQAIKNKCDLIIAHHPMIFRKINKLDHNNAVSKAVITAIGNNIQVYSAHTNLDSAKDGIADELCYLLGIKNTRPIEMINNESGLGRIGSLEKGTSLDEILKKVKSVLKTDNLKLINPLNKRIIKTVAVCPGSGGDLLDKLDNVDLYITADIRYHTALEVQNTVVIDAGHFETERIILPKLAELLEEFSIEIHIAQEESPWQVV